MLELALIRFNIRRNYLIANTITFITTLISKKSIIETIYFIKVVIYSLLEVLAFLRIAIDAFSTL